MSFNGCVNLRQLDQEDGQEMQEKAVDGDETVFFANWNGQLAGCGAFAPTATAGMAEIKRVYVRSDFRRHGIARALTHQLIARAPQAGYHTAAISTWDDNSRALALYRQLGFVPIAQFKEHASTNLVYLGLDLSTQA